MQDVVQVKADIPRQLKRRLFSEFALREVKFNRWLTVQIEDWLEEIEAARLLEHMPQSQEVPHAPTS